MVGPSQAQAALPLQLSQAHYPNLFQLANAVVSVWPEHAEYLSKSISVRSPALMRASDSLAGAINELSASSEREHAEDYRWLCDRIFEEEVFFARNDRYRYSTFAETLENVYSDHVFMKRYMNGLLYSQALWYMHASTHQYYSQRLSARLKKHNKVLEVGSGHGLLLFLALRDFQMQEAVAWDLSAVSLDQTREALDKLGALGRARFAIQDMNKCDESSEKFDLVILSHLLEHLENPVASLQNIRNVLEKTGLVYVNVPLNAPMPDHLILLRDPSEAEKLLVDGGFRVVEMATHTTQGLSLSRCLQTKSAVTCSIIAEAR